MLFNSFEFLIFFPLSLIFFLLTPGKWKTCFLMLAGWYFYSFWNWRFVSLIIISTVVDYCLALMIQSSTTDKFRKLCVFLSVAVNLGILGFFKYFNFFSDSFHSLSTAIGISLSPVFFKIILPVGISFYTFQTMAYTIDVYRGHCKARKNFFDVAAYVTFYPQLVAGPIERPDRLLPQLETFKAMPWQDFVPALNLIMWGLFKKIVIADNLAPMTEYVFDTPAVLDTGLSLLGVYAFAFQIYCDFSGYTDIARGVAKFFGVELMENFNMPYIANSIADFWKRWHISLSTWLRDYLYIPLGGNRLEELKTYRNLIVTMLLGGLWHGASWMFVIWGFYQGFLLIIEKFSSGYNISFYKKSPLFKTVKILFTFNLVCLGWVFFRAQDIPALKHWLEMFASFKFGPAFTNNVPYLLFYISPVLIYWGIRIFSKETYKPQLWLRFLVITVLFYGIIFLGIESGREFIYFQF